MRSKVQKRLPGYTGVPETWQELRMMAEISQVEGRVRVEAWIRANIIARASALFLIPAEMEIESGGLRGVVPRRIARNAVNHLLATLGQAPIP